MKAELSEALQESYNTKDGSGKFKTIYNKGELGNIGMWKCSEDEHFINIIPYFAGKNNPTKKEGKLAHNLDFYVHRKVGLNEDTYICLQKTYGKKCPICEEQAMLRKQDDYDEAYVKSLNSTRRVIYNIECLDSEKEQRKGVQLFEVSHWLFEKELAELAKKPRGGGTIEYPDPDTGKVVCFRKKGSGPTSTEYKAFQFVERTEPVSDEVLNAALTLDQIVHIPSYDEVRKAFFGIDADEEENEEEIEEKKVEAEVSRRPAVKPKFVCPGTRPDDFGELEECDDCPDVEKCETEYNATLTADVEPEPEPEPEVVESKRLRRPAPTAPVEEPVKEEPAGRIRRRPGA